MNNFRDLERLLKPLANKRRLSALSIIKRRKEVTVGEIAQELKLSIQATSHHLQLLARADIIESEQRSLSVFYSIAKSNNPVLKPIIDSL